MTEHEKNNQTSEKGIVPGVPVVVVLHSPREKYWGLLTEVRTSGVFMKCLDINAVEDWSRAVVRGEEFVGPTDQFFPMWRVERLTRDERSGEIPSMREGFEARTGRSLNEFM